jgi:formate hydrogenlyase subunit 6/NADH:ubiquinone oxidoreductase subunit I
MMFKILKLRFKRGTLTTKYPAVPIKQSERCKGLPVVFPEKCTHCGDCSNVCPVGAIELTNDKVIVDAGQCIFCGACERTCKYQAIKLSQEIELATKVREHTRVTY